METLYTEKDFTVFLNQQNKIYLYGAGTVGRLLAKRLARYHVPVFGYIETHPVSEAQGDYLIFPLKSVRMEENPCIVIATMSKFHQEILKNLDGYGNVFLVSDSLVRRMMAVEQRKLQFQIHIVEHCNLNCRGCYHFSPLAREEYLSLSEYEKDIARLSELFDGQMERILLLGGEPLLHPDVSSFFRVTRKHFPSGEIHILTNGLLLLQMEDEFYKAIRECKGELWVTKYPVNFDYSKAEEFALKHGVEIHYFSQEPVRSLGHQPLDIAGSQDALKNFNKCYRANECIDLKHGRMYSCIIPAEIRAFSEYYNLDISVTEQDYVDIYKVKSAEELLEQMGYPMPFCRYCNRNEISVFGVSPWARTKHEMKEWTE